METSTQGTNGEYRQLFASEFSSGRITSQRGAAAEWPDSQNCRLEVSDQPRSFIHLSQSDLKVEQIVTVSGNRV